MLALSTVFITNSSIAEYMARHTTCMGKPKMDPAPKAGKEMDSHNISDASLMQALMESFRIWTSSLLPYNLLSFKANYIRPDWESDVYNNLAILEVIGQSPGGLPDLNPTMPVNLLIRVLLDGSKKIVATMIGKIS